jgi:hypothetical protein
MKGHPRFAAAAVALIVAAGLAVGCGNGEQNDYVDQVNEIQTQLADDLADVGAGPATSNPKEAAQAADQIAAVFGSAADELETVEPPEDVADLHTELVSSLRGIGKDVTAASDAFTSGNPQEAQQAALDLTQAATQAQTQLDSLVDQINTQLQD